MDEHYDLFISYSSRNSRFVRRLAEDLQGSGLSVWLDALELEVGDQFRRKIEDGISHSRYFCLVVSEPAMKSYYVRRMELEAAFTIMSRDHRESFILPIIYQQPKEPPPPMLAGLQHLKFTNPKRYPENVRRIVRKITETRENFTGARIFKNIKISSHGFISGIGPASQLPYTGDSVRVIYEKGLIVKVETYSDGRITGFKMFEHDDRGRVYTNSLYRNDQYVDTWQYEYEPSTGRRKRKIVYQRGGPVFAEIDYDEKNQQIEERIALEHVPSGYTFGFARRTFTYSESGELETETWFDAEGNKIPKP
ncbi:MAG: TIR domain-containing protein [Chloroflexi bacterium]|nr:TIR domain-containing protein [Chloroflexota bacterium]